MFIHSRYWVGSWDTKTLPSPVSEQRLVRQQNSRDFTQVKHVVGVTQWQVFGTLQKGLGRQKAVSFLCAFLCSNCFSNWNTCSPSFWEKTHPVSSGITHRLFCPSSPFSCPPSLSSHNPLYKSHSLHVASRTALPFLWRSSLFDVRFPEVGNWALLSFIHLPTSVGLPRVWWMNK